MQRVHAFSVDLEDWYHPELVVRAGGIARPRPRIEKATRNILSLLERMKQRATFFVLGEVARKYPELIQQIHDDGHEIACHGMSHKPLWEHNSQSFARELKQFDHELHEVLKNVRAKGFRAPTFSLDSSTAWALDVLAEQGYQYDCSIFPMRNRLYGVSGAPLGIYRPSVADLRRHDDGGKILEFPPTVLALGPVRIPVAGGAYLRILPGRLSLKLLRAVESERPVMIYVHPWECDHLTPRLPLGFFPRFVTYFGIKGALAKLELLFGKLRFSRIDEVLDIERD
ncbi:MAG: polysaccharide deacetylase family protein [Candidatus Hydrogenedentota bacterium]|nr:MAG: polysaccharide deacetylase family protein [Candidatus Hydrogenedentota bacterium]